MTTEQHTDGPLPVGAPTADDLGVSGPHTHPVSAPHELTQEPGTPGFSKGPHPAEQRATGADDLTDRDNEKRGSASPGR